MNRATTLLQQYTQTMLTHWKWLHAHPELSGQEKETAAYVAAQLREMGLDPKENVGGHGVTALIQGSKPGKCLALRADMDALPITEATGVPFASVNPGVMHACGHDAHTAMLLAAAHVLNRMKDELCGSVKLIFQPSEETADNSGAKRMIADGVLENPRVDAIIAQHMNPNRPSGTVTILDGTMTAASDRFFITVRGQSCHASKPNQGVDAIVVGAQIITALQTIVSRNVNPTDSCVITIGKVTGGTRYNVVAGEFTMEGTCRNLNPEIREAMPQRLEQIIRGIAHGMGAEYEFRYVKGYPPAVNDPTMFQLIWETTTALLGADRIAIPEPALGGEDFAFYAEQVPAAFFRTGCHKEDTPIWPVHNEHFLPDEQALYHGAHVMITSALNFLSQN